MLGLLSYNLKKAEKLYTNNHLKGNNTDYQKFIVLSYRRSGTNFFLDLLRSHPHIVAYSGLFGNNLGYVYTGYPPTKHKSVIKYRNKKPVEFLNKSIFRCFSDNIKAVGFKITYDTRHTVILNYLHTFPDLKIINLRRKNIFRMVLSNAIAVKTKKWHAIDIEHEKFINEIGAKSKVKIIDSKKEKSALPNDFQIHVDYDECLKAMKEIKMYTDRYESFFPVENTLIVYYEDIVKSFDDETGKVLDFLGIEKIELKTMLKKINNKKLYDIVSNYNELKKKFKETEWYQFLDD